MENGERAARSQALELLEQRKYREALDLLKQHLSEQTDGEGHALLALAHYHLEEYPSAAEQYTVALQHDATNQEWTEMLAAAKANAAASVEVQVPAVYFFDRDKLLAKPEVPEGALPPAPMQTKGPGLLRKLRNLIGIVIGVLATFVTDALIWFVGNVIGYKGEVWTNWYRRRTMFAGVLTLAYLRELLNKNNLKNTYPKGTLIGFQPTGQVPPPGVTHYRTADGSWNNFLDPKEWGRRHPISPERGKRRDPSGDGREAANPKSTPCEPDISNERRTHG